MHSKLVPIQRSRRDTFASMANAKFYREFINTGRLKTITVGRNRYTTPEWESECLDGLVEQDGCLASLVPDKEARESGHER